MSLLYIDDDTLVTLAKRIRPLKRFDGILRRVKSPKGMDRLSMEYLRQTAFLWDPRPGKVAINIKPLKVITTMHSYGAPSFFKPSIAEVLADIPDSLRDHVVAFEVNDPRLTGDCHLASTTLYVKEA